MQMFSSVSVYELVHLFCVPKLSKV